MTWVNLYDTQKGEIQKSATMPADDETSESVQPTKLYFLDMKKILTMDSKIKEKRHISDIVGALSIPQTINGVSSYKSCDIDRSIDIGTQIFKSSDGNVSLKKYTNYNECCEENLDVSSKFLNLKISDSFTNESSKCIQSAQFRGYSKSISELNSYSLKELQILLEDLSRAVEEVSGELVQLLLENDALQQESDARNISIEQLLQLAVRNTENELRPIQMSVILPSNESDAI